MKLNAPHKALFLLSVIVVGTAIASKFVALPFVSENHLWVATAGWAVLALACMPRSN